MGYCIPAAYLIASLLCLAWLLHRTRPCHPNAPASLPIHGPRVAVVVPLAGKPRGWEAQLASLLAQDYRNYHLYVVAEEPESQAAEAARRLTADGGRGIVVPTGPAIPGGRKNRNLLAGVLAAGGDYEVLVFIDASHEVPGAWLSGLLEPIIEGRARVATAYHRVRAETRCLFPLGFTWCVGLMGLAQSYPCLTQVWGGSMAITREVFQRLEVAGHWRSNVVDDLILTDLARRHGEHIALSPVWLTSRTDHLTARAWRRWLIRQIAFFKYQFPLSWIALGLGGLGVTLSLVYCLLVVLLCLFRLSWPGTEVVATLVALGGSLLLAGRLRQRLAPHCPYGAWLLAGCVALGTATWCYAATTLSMSITWRGVHYRVAWGGRVLDVREEKSPSAQDAP